MREFLLAFKEACKPFRRLALELSCHGCQTNHPSLFQHECAMDPSFNFTLTMELITLTPQEDVLRALLPLIIAKNTSTQNQFEKISLTNLINLWRERPFEELRHSQRMQSQLQTLLFPPTENSASNGDEDEPRSRYKPRTSTSHDLQIFNFTHNLACDQVTYLTAIACFQITSSGTARWTSLMLDHATTRGTISRNF